MAGYLPLGGGGGAAGSSGAAIAEDMFFFDTQDRDIWTQENPSRLSAGIACAVGLSNNYSYYMWDANDNFWRDANLIYQGSRGEKGDKGDKGNDGADGDPIEYISMDEVDGTLSTTITTESGHSVSSTPIVLPTGDEVESLSNTFSNNQLVTTLTTEAGKQVASSPVTIEGGGGGGNGVTIEQVQEIADEAEASAKAASIPKTGGTVSGDLNFFPHGIGFNVGEDKNDRYKITFNSQNLVFSYYDGSFHRVIEQHKTDFINFKTQPKFNNKDLATKEYVDQHSGGGGGGGVSLEQVHEIADEAEANAKSASLPITGGLVQGDKPTLELYVTGENEDDNVNALVKVGETRGNNPYGYMRYNYRTRTFSIGTSSGEPDDFYDILYTTYWLDTVNFFKKPQYENINLATETYVDDLVTFAAPDNTLVKIVNGQLVAATATEIDGTVVGSPSSLELGAHKISSMGDGIGVTNMSTEQDRVLLFQDIENGITKRPYTYKMTSTESEVITNVVDNTGVVAKDKQVIDNIVTEGYYIIEPNTIEFNFDDPQTEFRFVIYDFDKKVFSRLYSQDSSTVASMTHEAIVIDGVANISFSVVDASDQPIALTGSELFDTQKFTFAFRTAERAYLAYEGEGGGSGGEYPKNPVFETVKLDMFAGSDATKHINFLANDLTITNDEDDYGVTLEGSHVTLSAGEADVVLNADELDMGFKEIINIQGGNKAASAVNLAQVESMLKNLFLRKEEVTLNDNILELDASHAGKNVFVLGGGLNSGLKINSNNFEDYQVVQITRSSTYENPAIPLTIAEGQNQARYLVQGTTTFGVFEGSWMILSDATVTLSEISQRAGFQQYVAIRAGEGMTSAIDQFGIMTLNVVGGGGGNPSFEIDDDIVPIIKDKEPVASAISVEFDQLIAPYGQQVAGHIMDSRGEVLAVNSHASVTQPIDTIGRYSNPKIFKEVDTEQPSTFINTNFHTDGVVLPSGQEIVVHSDDYIWVRTEQDTIHFRAGKIGSGYEFSIVDQHENLIYKLKSAEAYNSNSVVHIKCPSLTLRANKSYHFIVKDLNGNPLTLLGASGIQSWAFDYWHLEQHELLTNQDSVLPDVVTFEHVKTLQITDHTQASGITFNANGTLEVAGQLNMQDQHILQLSAAEHDHEATNLGQVKSLIADADFEGTINIDGQPVNDIQLNEDDFIYTYNEYSKVLHLNTKNNGGGGGTADGTVNPIISENLMTGYLVEFATEDGKFIRSSNVRWIDIQNEHERIWDKLDPAYKTAITAQTEAAANTLAISHTKHDLSQLERKVTHERMVNDDQALRIAELQVEDTRQDKHINSLDIEHQKTRTSVNNHQVEIENLTADYVTLQGQQETTTADLTALETEVTTIATFPLERMAAGEFEETLSIADSFDTLSSSSSHYLTPRGSEVEYHLPPDARTVEPNYTIKLTVDGVTHDALKLTATAIRAGMKPMKELVDGVDAQDAVTVNQLVPIHEAISKIHDRLNVIEAMLGIISPPEDQFPVYVGRMDESTTNSAEAIKNMGHVVNNVTADTLLTTDFAVQGHNFTPEKQYSYSVIAYPTGVVEPDPLFVSYGQVPKASREHYELVIDGVMYIVLQNQYPDGATDPIIYRLVQ